MNTELQTFEFQSHQLTLIADETGEPWFVAKEVAEILEYSDAFEMTKKLDEDEVQNRQIAGFGNRGVNIINESGLYSLILTSRKPEAKAFKKWVTSEVLPSIRKTGGYVKPDSDMAAYLEEVKSHLETQKQLAAAQQDQIKHIKSVALSQVKHAEGQLLVANNTIAYYQRTDKLLREDLQRAIRSKSPITETEAKEIVESYQKGLTIPMLHNHYHRSPTIIRRTLREAGVIA